MSNVSCSKKKEDGNDVTEPVLEDDNLSHQQEAADGNVEAQSQRYVSGLFFYARVSFSFFFLNNRKERHKPMKSEHVMNTIEVYQNCWLCSLQLVKFSFMWFALSGGEEGGVSTDEDAAYRDDLNDQSYDPKGER